MAFFVKKINPSQIGQDEPVVSCVLFVHGLAGGIFTWRTFSHHLVSQWHSSDSFGIEYDQYTVDFSIPVVGFILEYLPWVGTFKKAILGGPDLNILAQSLDTVVNQVCAKYENVIIVAHSMGGLIARQYLVNNVKATKTTGKVRGLITYATLHHGSLIASYFKAYQLKYLFFPLYSISKQIHQMCRINSPFLDKLNSDWETLRMGKRVDFHRVVGERDPYVDRDSAAYEWGDPFWNSASNKNHFNIIEPKTPNDPAFMVTFNYLMGFKNKLEEEMEQEELDSIEDEEWDDD